MHKLNLMAHCGADFVDRQVVMSAPTPDGTYSHRPVPHGVLLEMVEDELGQVGFEIVDEAHALTPDNARHFGTMQLRNGRIDDDFSLVLGLRNSHDMRFPAGIAVGSGVFVCDNLAFSGEISLSRKHTVNVMRDLPGMVTDAIARVPALQDRQAQRVDAYKLQELKPRWADAVIIEMFRRGIVNVQRIPKVIEEFETPSHDEFAEDGFTAWRLFNAATEALKPQGQNQLAALPGKTRKLHGLMDELCGIDF